MQLTTAICHRIFPVLGGESDQHLSAAPGGREGREHVLGPLELDRTGRARVLFQLVGRRRRRTEVGDGGGHQQHVAGGEQLGAGGGELRGGPHLDRAHARGRRHCQVRGDQRHRTIAGFYMNACIKIFHRHFAV